MGIPVNDPEDPAGYDCNYANSKTSSACKCSCSCSNRQSASNSNSNSSSNNNSSSRGNCNSSNSSSCKHTGRTNKSGATTLTLTFANNSSCGAANNYQYSKTETLDAPLTAASITRHTRDLVGNSKEYRIESNKSDLRIIGNGNRIRIGCNQGNLQIIGNNTRLKITNNTGCIRYTGNEGRICLGSDSTQQIVDYIGNNGKLKVVKSAELLSEKIKTHKQKSPKNVEASATANITSNAGKCATSAKVNVDEATGSGSAASPSHSTPKKVKVKSASFGGDYSAQWRQFNELFEQQGWRNFDFASMPNLKCEHTVGKEAEQSNNNARSSKINTKSCKIDNNINIVSTYGNICIKNAVNVSM
ncbi:putative uncharacterized protein DDB_G0282133 [Bactrocera neohumeralis]|uniref:putative uncharacterized protein DDB_G0282133 n=1 Tax=Bactrocera neohumeralis TaxID=98809 RepID=UPI002166BD86|nr:putative uncharacterized protein DDB_G0282133 [Bactrocera neohumeralis]